MLKHLHDTITLTWKARCECQQGRVSIPLLGEDAVLPEGIGRIFGDGDCRDASTAQLRQDIIQRLAFRIRQQLGIGIVNQQFHTPVTRLSLVSVEKTR